MDRRRFLLTSLAGAFAAPLAAGAQEARKVYRIGWLAPGVPPANPAAKGPFRQGMEALGYVEGRDQSSRTISKADQICRLALQRKLPTIGFHSDYPHKGCLMSYAENVPDMFRRAAIYVDKILKGAKPADLPVEQAMKFELVINLKTAKALGLTIPPSLLAWADQVLE